MLRIQFQNVSESLNSNEDISIFWSIFGVDWGLKQQRQPSSKRG